MQWLSLFRVRAIALDLGGPTFIVPPGGDYFQGINTAGGQVMNKPPTPEQFRSSANRRTFLQGLAGGMAVLPALSGIGRAGSAGRTESTEELIRVSRGFTPSDQVDESYWRLVKEQFTIKPNLI